MSKLVKKVIDIEYHRNGVSGASFHVVLFESAEDNRRMVALVFEERFHVAVLDVGKLAEGNIRFGSNSWRGDNYEPELRREVKLYQERESRKFSKAVERGDLKVSEETHGDVNVTTIDVLNSSLLFPELAEEIAEAKEKK